MEDQLKWDEINQLRKATKNCISILKEKVSKDYRRVESMDLSFGFEKDDEEEEERKDPEIRFREY